MIVSIIETSAIEKAISKVAEEWLIVGEHVNIFVQLQQKQGKHGTLKFQSSRIYHL